MRSGLKVRDTADHRSAIPGSQVRDTGITGPRYLDYRSAILGSQVRDTADDMGNEDEKECGLLDALIDGRYNGRARGNGV
jgi:hypothetical protein